MLMGLELGLKVYWIKLKGRERVCTKDTELSEMKREGMYKEELRNKRMSMTRRQ